MPEHRPRKRFGQHFLTDRACIARIIAAIDPRREDRMVEIGPGLGALTIPLSERVHGLHVVEIDRDVARALQERFASGKVTVHAGDALRFDFAAFGPNLRVVGNLPYNISSPLLFHIAAASSAVRDCHFMLQREVVDRMSAGPGGKTYGRLSVMIQYRFSVEKLFNVPAGAFRPPPQVESAFVRLVPHATPRLDADGERRLSLIVMKAFSQRRKTLRNALAEVFSEEQLAQLGVDARLRAESLPVETFLRLARYSPEPATPLPG
jgi:16S rRNA (adenine1518-N6/adenine1519-N6)-dimethyltransferase